MPSVENFLSLLNDYTVIDLTQTMENGMPTFPGDPAVIINRLQGPDGAPLVNLLILNDHAGTHFDAPAHFNHDESDPARKFCHEIEPSALIGRGVRLAFGPFGHDSSIVTAGEIKSYEKNHAALREGDIAVFDFGWAKKWSSAAAGAKHLSGWPGLSPDACEYLFEKKVRALGTDCVSIDTIDGACPGHMRLLAKGVLIVENLTNLDKLPDEFVFIAMPLKIKYASGSPVRAIALI